MARCDWVGGVLGRREKPPFIPPEGPIPLGSKIRALRQSAGLRLIALAGMIQRDSSYLSKVELNVVDPTPDMVEKIARALRVSDDVLRQASRAEVEGWRAGARTDRDGVALPPLSLAGDVARRSPPAVKSALSDTGGVLDQLLEEARAQRKQLDAITQQLRMVTWRLAELAGKLSPPAGLPQEEGSTSESVGRFLAAQRALRRPPDLHAALKRAIKIIEQVQDPSLSPDTICIAFFGRELFDRAPDLRQNWERALRAALDCGWNIVHLMRFGEGHSRGMVFPILHLVGARGRYEPAIVSREVESPDNFVIVPGLGALALALRGLEGIAEAIVYAAEEPAVAKLDDRFSQLRQHSTPLLTIHDPFSAAFRAALAQIESYPSNRYLLMDGLSEVTIPDEVSVVRAMSIEDPASQVIARAVCQYRKQRQHRFRSQIRAYHFRDICSMAAITRLARDGEFPRDDALTHLGAGVVEGKHRAACIQAVIDLLTDEGNKYELGLLDDLSDIGAPMFYLLKENHAVVVESWSLDAQERPVQVGLDIQSPEMAEEFRRHFTTLWEGQDIRTDKGTVIAWLRNQISLIP